MLRNRQTRNVLFVIFIALLSMGQSLWANTRSVDLIEVQGLKYPNSPEEGTNPIVSKALAPRNLNQLGGFNELLPFVTPSPDQETANSCMLMSMTGVAEFWLHRLNHVSKFVQNGDFDLSERWWMNLSQKNKYTAKIGYWFTDSIYLFNAAPAALNRDYRFTKGWYHETETNVTQASPGAPGAVYDPRYNWIDDTRSVDSSHLIELPHFERVVLVKNEDNNQWAVGSAPENVVEQVIAAFQKYRAPIQVIYNHEGFWHSVFVVGYDENMSSENCPFIHETLDYYDDEASKADKEGDVKSAVRFRRNKKTVDSALAKIGGCHAKGMFYVRDSQYPDPQEEIYVYDPQNPSSNTHYSKRIILREFDWMRVLANHISVIYVTQDSVH